MLEGVEWVLNTLLADFQHAPVVLTKTGHRLFELWHGSAETC